MKPVRRLFVDVSYTRTQSVNVGIIRTVNRLLEEFKTVAPAHGMVCVPVVFHTEGFRLLPDDRREASNLRDSPSRRSGKERILQWIATGPIRHIVSAYFPLLLRRVAWSIFSWWDFNRLAKDLIPIDINPGDVIFLSDASWNYRIWLATFQARQKGARVVTVVYDLIPLRQPEFCPALTTIAFRKWLKRLIPESDGVICISRAVEDDLRQYAAELGISLPPTGNFRLGCDPISPATPDAEIRNAIRDFFVGVPCFTAIGSIEPRKNYALLIDAFEKLWASGVDVRLLIIGRRSSQCDDLLERIEHHSELGKRLLVIFNGTDQEVTFGYANSRALIFPSLAEGFGLPLVEARARGCRVIASDLPAFVELADGGVSIFPRNSLEALEALVRSHLSDGQYATIMMPFTWADSAHRCMALIERFSAERV